MIYSRALIVAAVATTVAANGVDNCPALPKLCIDPAIIHGMATTLTYLCPEPTRGPTTVHTTVTAYTTVTVDPNPETHPAPTVSEPAATPAPTVSEPAAPPKNDPPSEEPTTTITVKSTLTQFKTFTVTHAPMGTPPPVPSSNPPSTNGLSAVPSLTPPLITWSFSVNDPPHTPPGLTRPVITELFSLNDPPHVPNPTPLAVTSDDSTGIPPALVSTAVVIEEEQVGVPSLTPAPITWWLSANLPSSIPSLIPPVIMDSFLANPPSSVLSLTPPHITWEFSANPPSSIPSLTPPHITWEFSANLPSLMPVVSKADVNPAAPVISATESITLVSIHDPLRGINARQETQRSINGVANVTTTATGNATGNATATATTLPVSMAGNHCVSLVGFFVALLAAALMV